ncbi:MAG: hypothetical protein GIX03_11245 [Candidatus Eremiobacteraeota bacterium]|nr:hypothetical protein [Candidatus Eremiobacteraeota bacterium]MBC5803544.1 hypothetical protein [Candidatus Eremiobacteraeota bacterium]MBC5822873.1 hypothetical protein [Candidatus Eremiobacteraeota bacterium]
MEVDEVVIGEESTLVYEARSGVNPWLILGALLFVFAFVLGWRSAGGKQPRARARDIVLPPEDGEV